MLVISQWRIVSWTHGNGQCIFIIFFKAINEDLFVPVCLLPEKKSVKEDASVSYISLVAFKVINNIV